MAKAPTVITTGDLEGMRGYAVGNEVAVLDRIKADVAAGKDPFGEDEDDDDPNDLTQLPIDKAAATPAEPPAAPAPAPTPTEAPAAPAPAPTELPAAPAPAPTEASAPAPAPVEAPAAPAPTPVQADVAVDVSDLRGLIIPTIPTVDRQAFETARDTVRTQMDAIDARWEAGEITPQQRLAEIRPLQNQLDSLNSDFASQMGEARALARTAQATHEQVLGRIRAAGARDGLDYNQQHLQQQFDLASQMIQADPRNAALSWVDVAARADAQVRAINGVRVKGAAPAPSPTPAAAPAPAAQAPAAAPAAAAPPPNVPPTLRTMPTAAGAGAGTDTIAAKLAAGDANQRNALWEKMTPAQRAAARGDDDE